MLMKEIQFVTIGKAKLTDYEQRDIRENEVLTRTHYTLISAGTERANLLGLPNTGTGFGLDTTRWGRLCGSGAQ